LYYSQFRLSDKPKPDDVGLRITDRILSRIPRPLLPDGADVEPLPLDVPLPNNKQFLYYLKQDILFTRKYSTATS